MYFLILDPDYEEEKLKILAGERLPMPEYADHMPWGTQVYEEVESLLKHTIFHINNFQIMLPCWRDKASERPDFATVVKQLSGLLGEREMCRYEEQARVYKMRQDERSKAPQPPVRMDSLSGEPVEARQGYLAMEEVNRLDRTESRKSGYSIVAPKAGGYIGVQDIVNS